MAAWPRVTAALQHCSTLGWCGPRPLLNMSQASHTTTAARPPAQPAQPAVPCAATKTLRANFLKNSTIRSCAGQRGREERRAICWLLIFFTPVTSGLEGLEVELETKLCEVFTITEKAPTRAFYWWKSAITAFTFKHVDMCHINGLLHDCKTSNNAKVRFQLYLEGCMTCPWYLAA